MSDWLLQGVDPKTPGGREFYLIPDALIHGG